MLSKKLINEYRNSVMDPGYGKELVKAIKEVQKNQAYKLGWKKYKKIPRGFDSEHANADLLLYGGIGFEYEEKLPEEVFSLDIIEYIFNKFKDMAPIHFWLRKMIERVNKNRE